jgi:hypothetical protein
MLSGKTSRIDSTNLRVGVPRALSFVVLILSFPENRNGWKK